MRGVKTKVWEPAALVRESLSDELNISESVAQLGSSPLVDRIAEVTEITHIAAVSTENCVLVVRDGGAVVLFSAADARFQKTLYSHQHNLSVNHVPWCSGGYMATADASSLIQVWTTAPATGNLIDVQEKVLDTKVPDSIQMIAVNPTGSYLLVCEPSSTSIYHLLKAENETVPNLYHERHGPSNDVWAWPPQQSEEFDVAAIGESTPRLWHIDEMTGKTALKATVSLTYDDGPLPAACRMSFTSTSQFLAVEVEPTRKPGLPTLLIYTIDNLRGDASESAPDEPKQSLTPVLALYNKAVRLFIGWREQTLVVVDEDLWVCSLDMASLGPRSGGGTQVTYTKNRHFFIPYELIGNSNGVAPVLASSRGCIAFPHGGSLSVIEDAFSWTFASEDGRRFERQGVRVR